MDYIAHKRNETDKAEQSLKDHLEETAKLCARFAECIGLSDYARFTGGIHDIGKYGRSFQRRVRGELIKAEHSTSGAQEAFKLRLLMAAFCIAGHHAGLPDIGNASDNENEGTLCGKILRQPDDYSAWISELPDFVSPDITEPVYSGNLDYFFMIRIMFSCLVDADYLDTERFMLDGNTRCLETNTCSELSESLNRFRSENWSSPKEELNILRSRMLDECIECGQNSLDSILTLTMPTGAGKTVSSLAFALNYAIKNNKKRIIYVIPYTSIIEQNAEVFRKILGSSNVIENHCNVDLSCEKDNNTMLQKILASENWDAPVIVTTAVRFFESLYSCRPSSCRKLHNIADSVIIFDEAQMLPVPLLLPCVSAIWELTQNCRATAVLCTATQPSLEYFFKHLSKSQTDFVIPEICPSANQQLDKFNRVSFCYDGKLEDDVLAARLNEHRQVLCIVNKKKHANRLFSMLDNDAENFHLSTYMYPAHRKAVIAQIKQRLRDNKPCRVISTSLIEAGVDIDFPCVFRAISGLDSILQAAGRCNRENKRDRDDCLVHIFDTDDILGYQQLNVEVTRDVLKKFGSEAYCPEAIKDYFYRLYYLKDTDKSMSIFDQKNILKHCEAFKFAMVSDEFTMIEKNAVPVYIPTDDNMELIADLRAHRYSKDLFRQLQSYSVNLYDNELKKLFDVSAVEIIDTDFRVLTDPKFYDSDAGLTLPVGDPGIGICI